MSGRVTFDETGTRLLHTAWPKINQPEKIAVRKGGKGIAALAGRPATSPHLACVPARTRRHHGSAGSHDRHAVEDVVGRAARGFTGRGIEPDGHALPRQDDRVVRGILDHVLIAVLAHDARVPDRADRHGEIERQRPADDRRGAGVGDRDVAREPGPPVIDVGERRRGLDGAGRRYDSRRSASR